MTPMGMFVARRRQGALIVAVLLLAACGSPLPATPPATSAPAPAPISSSVADGITQEALRADLTMLAEAGRTSASFRALGSTGYNAAVDGVERILRASGWSVRDDPFEASAFSDDGASTLDVGGRTFGRDQVRPLIYAPGGTVEGPVVTIGWAPGAASPGGQGCLSTDYGTLPAHAIVVVGPDDCYRRQAVTAAQQAGAEGFVAVLAGRASGPPLRATLITADGLSIPAVAVSTDAADALRAAADAHGTARIVSTARTGPTQTRSVIAELAGATPERVVMLGAHLDSVIDGPGMNDNGTGVAALLGLARALTGTRPQATIRLAFWGAEEVGLVGSTRYVTSLDNSGLDAIVAYLNADMIGSPNGYAGVYEEQSAPSGSAAVRALLLSALVRLGATAVPADTGGGSDHAPFGRAGVPVGGVFSGASEPLTDAQAANFGGAAGLPADPCYHQACDSTDNVNAALARVLAAALADTAVRIAENPVLVTR